MKKKILIINEFYPPNTKGGAEISTKVLAESLNEEVHILTPNYSVYKNTVSKEGSVIVHRFKSPRYFLFKNKNNNSSQNISNWKLNLYMFFSAYELKKKIKKRPYLLLLNL